MKSKKVKWFVMGPRVGTGAGSPIQPCIPTSEIFPGLQAESQIIPWSEEFDLWCPAGPLLKSPLLWDLACLPLLFHIKISGYKKTLSIFFILQFVPFPLPGCTDPHYLNLIPSVLLSRSPEDDFHPTNHTLDPRSSEKHSLDPQDKTKWTLPHLLHNHISTQNKNDLPHQLLVDHSKGAW